MKCENCGIEHEGAYASGRFCSKKCSKSFSTKAKRKEINEKVSIKLKGMPPWHKGKKDPFSKESKEKMSISAKLYFANHPGENRRRNLGKITSKETRLKISNSLKGKTGGYREKGGRGKQGWYKGIYCNSSWELAYVIYCKDNDIDIIRNKEGFKYLFNDKEYRFYPDFILNGIYVEVKGYMDDKNKAKISQFKENLIVIDKYKIKPYIEYAIQLYGENYISLYE